MPYNETINYVLQVAEESQEKSCPGRNSHTDINKDGCHGSLPVYENEAKISQMRALPFCMDFIIWNQKMTEVCEHFMARVILTLTNTAAHYRVTIKMIWLHFWGTLVSAIFILLFQTQLTA